MAGAEERGDPASTLVLREDRLEAASFSSAPRKGRGFRPSVRREQIRNRVKQAYTKVHTASC